MKIADSVSLRLIMTSYEISNTATPLAPPLKEISIFKITRNEPNDPEVPEIIICTMMMYGETLTAATRHNTSCSEDKYVLKSQVRRLPSMIIKERL